MMMSSTLPPRHLLSTSKRILLQTSQFHSNRINQIVSSSASNNIQGKFQKPAAAFSTSSQIILNLLRHTNSRDDTITWTKVVSIGTYTNASHCFTNTSSTTRNLHTQINSNENSIISSKSSSSSKRTTIPTLITSRQFAAGRGGGRRGNNTKGKNSKQERGLLVNEDLIQRLLRNSNSSGADSITIRLILPTTTTTSKNGEQEEPSPSPSSPPTEIQLVSLTEAISIASELNVDLVGINVESGNNKKSKKEVVPVVKAVDYQKMVYAEKRKKKMQQQEKRAKMQKNGGANVSLGKKVTKEFSFKAGIDNYDLDRKVKNMISYLTKGHSCQVTITTNRRNLMADKDVVKTTLNRVCEVVGEHGKTAGQLKTNPFGSRGSLMFQPNRK